MLRSYLTSFSTARSKIGLSKMMLPSAAYQKDSTAVLPNPCFSPSYDPENKTAEPDCDQKKEHWYDDEREITLIKNYQR